MERRDAEFVMARVEDLAMGALKKQNLGTTGFLDPATQVQVERYLRGISGISYKKAGGYPEAERNIFAIYPDWMSSDDIILPLSGLSIEWDDRYYNIGHRDILGATLGLGIKREKIGDIILNGSKCQLVVIEDISPFIMTNLTKVARAPVRVSAIDLEQLDIPEPEFKDIHTTVPSMRLDCIACSGFGFSRSKILPYIKEGRVFVNWELVTKPDFEIRQGDLITLRGFGRVRVSEIGGLTRKNRISITLQKSI